MTRILLGCELLVPDRWKQMHTIFAARFLQTRKLWKEGRIWTFKVYIKNYEEMMNLDFRFLLEQWI